MKLKQIKISVLQTVVFFFYCILTLGVFFPQVDDRSESNTHCFLFQLFFCFVQWTSTLLVATDFLVHVFSCNMFFFREAAFCLFSETVENETGKMNDIRFHMIRTKTK